MSHFVDEIKERYKSIKFGTLKIRINDCSNGQKINQNQIMLNIAYYDAEHKALKDTKGHLSGHGDKAATIE